MRDDTDDNDENVDDGEYVLLAHALIELFEETVALDVDVIDCVRTAVGDALFVGVDV